MVEVTLPTKQIRVEKKSPVQVYPKEHQQNRKSPERVGRSPEYDKYTQEAKTFFESNKLDQQLGLNSTPMNESQKALFQAVFAYNLALKESEHRSATEVDAGLTEDVLRAVQQYPSFLNLKAIRSLRDLGKEARFAQRDLEIATFSGTARDLAGVVDSIRGVTSGEERNRVIASEIDDIKQTLQEDPSWYQEANPYARINLSIWKPNPKDLPTSEHKYLSWDEIKDQIMHVEQQAFSQDHVFSEEQLKGMFNRSDATVVLVRDKGKIVGYSVTTSSKYEYGGNTEELSDSDTSGKTSAYLESIAILPRYQRKMLGDRMLAGLESTLRDKGYLYLELHTANPGLMKMIDRNDKGRIIEGGEPMDQKNMFDRGVGQGGQVKYRISLYDTNPEALAQAEEFIRNYDIKNRFGFNQRQLEIFKLKYAHRISGEVLLDSLADQVNHQREITRSREGNIPQSPIDMAYTTDNFAWQAAEQFMFISPPNPQDPADQERYNQEVEKIIVENARPKPKLENIQSVRAALTNDENLPAGEVPTWQRLSILEKPDGKVYSLMELNGAIRDTDRDYMAGRLNKLREIPSFEAFQGIEDGDLLNALTHGWMDAGTVPDVVTDPDSERGVQSRLLLATAEHMVSRIEIGVYKRFLASASPEQLAAMGLQADLRDVMTNVLTVSSRANPLFVRFMGYVMPESTDSPYAEGETSVSPEYAGTALFMPEGQGPYDLARLFPKESRALAQGFEGILRESAKWQRVPGAEAFRKHLHTLADLHKSNVDGTLPSVEDRQKAVQDSYNELLQSGFPIIITPQLDPGEKPPYIDPELKVSLVMPADSEQQKASRTIQNEMAHVLPTLGEDVAQFAENLSNLSVHRVVTLGAFGSNLVMRSVAQEEGSIILYLDEQERAFGQELAGKIQAYIDPDGVIDFTDPTTQDAISRMSLDETFMHEGDHVVFPAGSEEAQRLGADAAVTIGEVSADTLYRAMIPEVVEYEQTKGMISPGEVEMVKSQLAVGTLGTLLQNIELGKASEYYKSNIHLLNALLKPHGDTPPALELHEGKLRITNVDAFYATIKVQAQDVLHLYRDPEMNPEKADEWVRTHCTANEQSEAVLEALGIR